MKLTLACLAAAPAFSQEATCEQYASLAMSIMSARQTGTTIERAFELAEGNGVVEAFVLDAWTFDRYSDQQQQKYTIFEFGHLTESSCERGWK